MASELGAFQFDDVVESIRDKLVRRHPHVFGDAKIDDAAAQTMAWEQQRRLSARPEPQFQEPRYLRFPLWTGSQAPFPP
jgi:uncharacterized protein YabN with tetrapyrrole methylase and pyrophosphatase domain